MQQNRISDEELDQITGGRNLFEAFTTEFRGTAKKPHTLELDPEEDLTLSTLEMRANPAEKKKESRKIIKL